MVTYLSAKWSEVILKLHTHTHTQNVLLYVLLCVLYGKNPYCLLIMLSIEHVLYIHVCVCYVNKSEIN